MTTLKESKDSAIKKRLDKSINDNFAQPWNTQKDINTYAYSRVSTDKQQVENQFEDIAKYCRTNNIHIPLTNIYYDWAVSGSVSWKERNIKYIIDDIQTKKEPCTLIVVEVSRIARNSLESMELASIMTREMATMHDIKNEMVFTKDEMLENDTMLMKFFMLSLFSQIEKNTTRKRIQASLKNEKNKRYNKLDDYKEHIGIWKKEGLNANQITFKLQEQGLNVNKSQVYTMFKKL